MTAAPASEQSQRKQRLSQESGEAIHWHIPDFIRVGVLCCCEEAELRLAAHMLSCPVCRELELELVEEAAWVKPGERGRKMSCAHARNELFHLLEEGRPMCRDAILHINHCETCRDHVLEPAKLLYAQEVDEAAISAQD
jgi:hypothetical protein